MLPLPMYQLEVDPPECPECEKDTRFLDVHMQVWPESDDGHEAYWVCLNEDCGLCYHVFTTDGSDEIFHGCRSGAYPEIIDPTDVGKGLNDG